eukprot:scaffold159918_cov26-Prasinocladus_malaysianus.AAC.3
MVGHHQILGPWLLLQGTAKRSSINHAMTSSSCHNFRVVYSAPSDAGGDNISSTACYLAD